MTKRTLQIISLIKWVYLAFALLGGAVLVLEFLLRRSIDFSYLFSTIWIFGLYLGLKNRVPVIVPIQIISSVFAMVSFFFYDGQTVVEMVVKIVGMFFNFFLLYFFTQKDVKKYFGRRSVFLFNS